MDWVLKKSDAVACPVLNHGSSFPVNNIYCVGRNYFEHAKEMGMDERDPPFFFMKPTDAIVQNGAKIPYPPQTKNYHYEGELVVAIGGSASSISVADANNCIYGFGVGLDMTRRDVQIAAREMGRPWDMGKGFDNSAPCSEILPVTKIGHPEEGRIRLAVNGETKQDADIKDMIWNVPESISYLSGLVTLEAGDLIMTGTPAGVGPVISGDTMVVSVEGVTELTCTIA